MTQRDLFWSVIMITKIQQSKLNITYNVVEFRVMNVFKRIPLMPVGENNLEKIPYVYRHTLSKLLNLKSSWIVHGMFYAPFVL